MLALVHEIERIYHMSQQQISSTTKSKPQKQYKHLVISPETYRRLQRYGNTPTSFDTIIRRLLDEKEGRIGGGAETVE
jgi:hypothetical protein